MGKHEFLINSISDIQSTIRAIDAKLFGTIALFIIPLSEYSTLESAFKQVNSNHHWPAVILIVLLIGSWLLGILTSFIGILSLHNPSNKIKASDKAGVKGNFYNAGLFTFNIWNSIWPKNVKSNSNFKEIHRSFDLKNKEIFKELVFEQSKITFIRDVKIYRQRLTMYFLIAYTICIVILLIFDSLTRHCGS